MSLLTLYRSKGLASPASIDGLQLWLDAADTSTITESGGDVSQWNDKSGNGNHVSQATAAAQPVTGTRTINGLNVLDFDGNDDNLVSSAFGTTITQPYDAFVVLQSDSIDSSDYAVDGIAANNRGGIGISGGQFRIFANTLLTGGSVTNTASIVRGSFNSSASAIVVNGAVIALGDAGADSRTGIRVGSIFDTATAGGLFWAGAIAEILIYDSALSTTDREAVEAYLADKWGISIPGSVGQFTWDSDTSSPAASQTSTRTVTNTHLGMKRCVVNDAGVVQYYLNPFDSTEKADGTAANLDGTDGQVMVEIPKFYTRRTVSGTETTWFVSDKPRIGFSVHPAFVKDGVEVDYRYYGAYHASVYAPATGSITATTEDNPVKITSNNHGLETNCQVTITGTGIAELDDESFVITKVDSNNFTLNGLDGTGIGTAATGSWEQTYLSGLNLDDTTGILSTGTTNELASVSGVYPIVGLTRAEARSLAANRGSVWRQLDFTLWSAVQLLYLVEYQTFNSQSVLGNGNTNDSYVSPSSDQADSPHSIAGRSNSLGNASTDTTSGANTVTNPPTAFMSYRGIENFYGNAWQWVDGIVKDDANIYITNNRSDFSDSSNPSGHDLVFNGFPNGPDGYIDAIADVDDYFLASSVSGSSSTYLTDYAFTDSGTRVVRVGGNALFGALAGAFAVGALDSSGYAVRNIGARLTC